MKRLLLQTIGVVLLGAQSLPSLAQNSAADRFAQATNHLRRVAAKISADALTDIASLEDWTAARPRVRQQFLDSLGLDPMPKRTALNARITGRLDRSRYTIEKLVFESLPRLYVTANFYLPKGADSPLPVILYLCGHAPHPVGAKVYYQDRAAWFANNGFACLIVDTLEFGEVPGVHHGLHDQEMWHWLSLGYTPAGVEVWNAMRAIDYLETRREVDPRRLGVTGISGGGAITWFTAAADKRVAVAAPVCSTYTFGSQAMNWRAFGQCDCIYFNNTYQLDLPHVAALTAPRPLLMISGRRDADFPPDGYHEVFRRGQGIYQLFGKAGLIREFDDEVGHADPPQFRKAAREWMRQWLQSNPEPLPVSVDNLPPEKAEDLACLDDLPPRALNYGIHHQFTRLADTQKRPGTERRKEVVAGLKERVFRWFPSEPIPFETEITRNTGGWVARYAAYKEVTLQTEPGVRIRAQLLSSANTAGEAQLLVWIKRAEDSIYAMDFDELLPLLGRYTVLLLNPRFTERSLTAAERRDIEMTAAFTGRTIAAMQTWDLLRAIEWALTEEKLAVSSVHVFGKREMGIAGLYAALLNSRIQKVVFSSPPTSHWDGPALLNVLRVTDIPEVIGALGASRVFSIAPPDRTLRVTAVGSLAEALGL